jgi:hypothetical protein
MRPLRRAGLLTATAVILAAGCGESNETVTTATQATTATQTGNTETSETTETTETGTTSTPSTRCVQEAGLVLGYNPTSERDFCSPRVLEQRELPLFDSDQLRTSSIGELQFRTEELTRCEMRPDAVVVVRPGAGTALRLGSGTVGCQVDPGGPEVHLDVPGAVIDVRGTLFTLAAVAETTTITVHTGSLFVRSTADPAAAPAELRDRQQAVAARDRPLRSVDFQVGQAEAELVVRIRLGVLTLPPDALSELMQGGAASEGTLVTETAGQAKLLEERELVPALQPLTTSSIQRRSRLDLSARPDLVVGVGSFEALAPAFERLRNALGPDATLVHSPFAFPKGTTPDPTTTTVEGTTTATTTSPDTTTVQP